ncbi:DUF4870 domain-containing protein [Ulvibacter litoralis]|uniref:DUF4870 domain-containing protein n=1 Tax=Ulvibacter litoralis TaxID=227084 RepID=A0A1G7EZ71_9FLAO|nr:DUF4870 domain-containing protein [Ulvibacter litoralis]GHC53439.1 orotate phosphoribosyltransferase [Ulvibacter litoralis]SDE68645.1 hypothetical protein SAMN05421855_102218 [Ulvibacter litoralis]
MDTSITENQKSVSAFIHLSTFLKFLFPFANFFAPLLLWTLNKEKDFVDEHGKQAINFQLSIIVYTLLLGLVCIPLFIFFIADFVSLAELLDDSVHSFQLHEIKNLSGYVLVLCLIILVFIALFIFELYAVITATMQASKGKLYKYPFTISFIKSTSRTIRE